MNRLYALESMPTSTGSRADHRLPLRPSEIEGVARAIAAASGARGVGTAVAPSGRLQKAPAILEMDRGGREGSAGTSRREPRARRRRPAARRARARARDERGARQRREDGRLHRPGRGRAGRSAAVAPRSRRSDMSAGKVDLLVIIGGNPVYTAPADLEFADAMDKVPLRVHLGLYDDETSALCHWQIPETHFLESWSDARGYDGTVSIVQPLIAPLYGGKSAHELLAAMSDRPERSGYDLVREHWTTRPVLPPISTPRGAAGCTTAWCRTPRIATETGHGEHGDGGIAPRGSGRATVSRSPSATIRQFSTAASPTTAGCRSCRSPSRRLTWDNAVLVSPATADRLKAGGDAGDAGRRARSDHQPRRRAALPRPHRAGRALRRRRPSGRLRHGASRIRPDARGPRRQPAPASTRTAIRTSDALWFGAGLEIVDTGETYPLACTQYHHLMEGRGMVRAVTRDEFIRDPKSVHEGRGETSRRRRPSRCTPTTSTTATSGAWRSTSTPASAATPASSPARRRTTSRSSARIRCCAAARCTGSASTRYYRGAGRQPRDVFPAGAVHAVRERAVRGRLPGRRHGAQRRRAERHGLQPLRRHAVLLEQLSVQGPPLQLPALSGLEHAEPQAAAQSRRHGAQPRRHGEVHLLRAAHQRGEDRRREAGPPRPRRRDQDGVPAGLSGRRDRVRRL